MIQNVKIQWGCVEKKKARQRIRWPVKCNRKEENQNNVDNRRPPLPPTGYRRVNKTANDNERSITSTSEGSTTVPHLPIHHDGLPPLHAPLHRSLHLLSTSGLHLRRLSVHLYVHPVHPINRSPKSHRGCPLVRRRETPLHRHSHLRRIVHVEHGVSRHHL